MSRLRAILKRPFLRFRLWRLEREITAVFDRALSIRIDAVLVSLEQSQ